MKRIGNTIPFGRQLGMGLLFFCLVVWMGCGQRPIYDSVIEFPIVTQFPEVGGTEPDRRRLEDRGWGRYSAAVTDHTAPPRDRVVRSVRRWEEVGGLPVDIYNGKGWLQSGVKRMQVVNNVVIGKTLWTVFLGSGWKRDGGPYLLIVSGRSGTSSNNSTVYGETGPLQLPDLVAQTGAEGHPVVLAMVNVGGRESQGNHPDVLRSIGAGIAFAKTHFRADDQKVVFAGKSRGGVTALMWGANPLELDYQAAAIFAHATVTDWGTQLLLANGTYPEIGSVVAEISAERKPAWQAGEKHEVEMRVARDCMTGTQDRETMQSRSPIGWVKNYHNTYVALGFGTHDPTVGLAQAFDFYQALEEAEIEASVEFTLRGGHQNSRSAEGALKGYLKGQLEGHRIELPVGRSWNQMVYTPEKGRFVYSNVDSGSPVWTVLPRMTTAQRKNTIYIGGPDGSNVYVKAQHMESGQVWIDLDTEIEWDYVRADLGPPPMPGRYRWTVEVGNQPLPDSAIVGRDGNGKRLPPETVVLEQERYVHEVFDRSENARTFGHAWVWAY